MGGHEHIRVLLHICTSDDGTIDRDDGGRISQATIALASKMAPTVN